MLDTITKTAKRRVLQEGKYPLEVIVSGKQFFYASTFTDDDLHQPECFFDRGAHFGATYPDVSIEAIYLVALLWSSVFEAPSFHMTERTEHLIIYEHDMTNPHHHHTQLHQYPVLRAESCIDLGPPEIFSEENGTFGSNALVDLYREGIRYGHAEARLSKEMPHD